MEIKCKYYAAYTNRSASLILACMSRHVSMCKTFAGGLLRFLGVIHNLSESVADVNSRISSYNYDTSEKELHHVWQVEEEGWDGANA